MFTCLQIWLCSLSKILLMFNIIVEMLVRGAIIIPSNICLDMLILLAILLFCVCSLKSIAHESKEDLLRLNFPKFTIEDFYENVRCYSM